MPLTAGRASLYRMIGGVIGAFALFTIPIWAVVDETIYKARSFAEILGGLGMDDFLATKIIGNGRNLHIASLARRTIEDCGAAHMGYDGYFVFEATDLPEKNGITIFGKAASYEAALALADIMAA